MSDIKELQNNSMNRMKATSGIWIRCCCRTQSMKTRPRHACGASKFPAMSRRLPSADVISEMGPEPKGSVRFVKARTCRTPVSYASSAHASMLRMSANGGVSAAWRQDDPAGETYRCSRDRWRKTRDAAGFSRRVLVRQSSRQ